MKSPVLDKAIQIIFRELSGIIPQDDYTEYAATRKELDKTTQTVFRLFSGEKLSRVVLEQYTIRSKVYGVVFNIYPKPEFGLPLFTFQLGGQIPERVIFVLDMIPIIETVAISDITAVYHKHAAVMENLGTSQEWVHQIASNNALVCQYKPLAPAKISGALTDYLQVWRDRFYLPATTALAEKDEAAARETILRFKRILHANDAGLAIYTKTFGAEMVKVIEQAAFGSEPVLEIPPVADAQPSAQTVDTNVTADNLHWTSAATQYLQEAPRFVRSKIKANAEHQAQELGVTEITVDFIKGLRK